MQPLKILVVDDDYSFAEFAKMLIESLGHAALTTLQADQTLPLVIEHKPDLVLMDYAMDEMSGVDAIRLLKSDPRTSKVPVILCSITKSQGEIMRAFQYGAAGFLPKPLSREVLKAAIEKVLGGSRS